MLDWVTVCSTNSAVLTGEKWRMGIVQLPEASATRDTVTFFCLLLISQERAVIAAYKNG